MPTLRTYTHLVPSSYERARMAIDGVFGLKSADGLEAVDHGNRVSPNRRQDR
jgi:hypothetical protein